MWGGFPKVIKKVFPNAAIIIDRFHVMKVVNKSLNKLRLDLDLKGLKNRCLLLNNNQSLSGREIQDLSELLHQSPLLSIAYSTFSSYEVQSDLWKLVSEQVKNKKVYVMTAESAVSSEPGLYLNLHYDWFADSLIPCVAGDPPRWLSHRYIRKFSIRAGSQKSGRDRDQK